MRVYGLTGGIASGKSTVAKMFAELGAPVIDADQIAREVVRPGEPALKDIVSTFGREVLDESGALDRKTLGALVFADENKRRALNAITHPRIAIVTQARLARLREQGTSVALYEAALLVENGIHRGLDGLIVVKTDESCQRERLATRDELDEAQVNARLAAQAPLEEKLRAATWVIDNSGSVEDTRRQVTELWNRLRNLP